MNYCSNYVTNNYDVSLDTLKKLIDSRTGESIEDYYSNYLFLHNWRWKMYNTAIHVQIQSGEENIYAKMGALQPHQWTFNHVVVVFFLL